MLGGADLSAFPDILHCHFPHYVAASGKLQIGCFQFASTMNAEQRCVEQRKDSLEVVVVETGDVQ